jgi:uncharacterized membrane protein
MRTLLTVIGAFLLGMGLLFCGQGLGLIRWPAESFMINQITWVYYGGGMAVLGVILIMLTRR